MRYIDINEVVASIPGEERQRLQVKHDSLEPMEVEARQELIDSGNPHWRRIKPYLEEASGRKCWFTESTNDGSLYDVEHFRPKIRKTDGEDLIHWYWFLAFNPINYRLSSRLANSPNINPETGITGGKGSFFDLLPGSVHAHDITGIAAERPILLDPCVESDTELLTFLPDGRPTLAPHVQGDEEAQSRVEISNLRLNLDYPTFNSGRERIYNKISRFISKADRCEGNEVALDFIKDEIRELIDPSAEYSSAAVCYLRGFRNRVWVEDIIFEAQEA